MSNVTSNAGFYLPSPNSSRDGNLSAILLDVRGDYKVGGEVREACQKTIEESYKQYAGPFQMKSIQFRIRPDCSQVTQVLQAHYYTRNIRKSATVFKAVIMSYTDDAVKAKLSALNETQDSIVTVAQWIMFHRYVDQCCWLLLQPPRTANSQSL